MTRWSADHTGIELAWGCRTDRGPVRTTNEDALLACAPVFVVADGMGGHAAGEVASGLVVDAFREITDRTDLTLQDVVSSALAANTAIIDAVDATPAHAGMGSTLTGMALVETPAGTHAAIVNVGDSRTYLLRDGALEQLTVDHSLVQELVDAGQLDEADVATHPERHVVTRVLGTDDLVAIDSWIVAVVPGDRLLLCSDGVSGVLGLDELTRCLIDQTEPQPAADRLVDLAIELGGRDNATVVVVDVVATSIVDDERSSATDAEIDENVDTLPRHLLHERGASLS